MAERKIDFFDEIEKVEAAALKEFELLDKDDPNYLYENQRIIAKREVLTDLYLREVLNDGGSRAAIESYANSRCIAILMSRQNEISADIKRVTSTVRLLAFLAGGVLVSILLSDFMTLMN